MRKRIIDQNTEHAAVSDQQWLDLEHIAQVEVTSEVSAYPIEAALIAGSGRGWRAGQPGQQTIRLLFDQPQSLTHIRLRFVEDERQRTQEFVLRWSSDGGSSYRDIVRQQYNFSPPGCTSEHEDYDVQLAAVTALELTIVPDVSGADVRATLAELRIR
jgi:hypothetical protein